MKEISSIQKIFIKTTIFVALTLIVCVLIYDPHLSPQSAAKGMYRSDKGCLMEYEDDIFYFKVFNSASYATAKKPALFWKTDYYNPYDSFTIQRHTTKIANSYYYYGKINKPDLGNVKTIKLIDSLNWADESTPLSLFENDEYFFFVFKLRASRSIEKKIVFCDSKGNTITDNANETTPFNLYDINNTDSSPYFFKESDEPEFNSMYNELVHKIMSGGKKASNMPVLTNKAFLTSVSEKKHYLFDSRIDLLDDIVYTKKFYLYYEGSRIILKVSTVYDCLSILDIKGSIKAGQEFYELETNEEVKEFIDMCQKLYKKSGD